LSKRDHTYIIILDDIAEFTRKEGIVSEGKMDKEKIRSFYEKNMYGVWKNGEKVTFECMGPDPKSEKDRKNPFEVIGGELVKISVTHNGRTAGFTVHMYLPDEDTRGQFLKGNPFVICMHPIPAAGLAISKGYCVIVMEIGAIASDDIRHKGAFYDIYPYGTNEEDQTGVLMAWAWGASKVLDAVYAGLDKIYSLDADASLVTGVSRWGKATAVCGALMKDSVWSFRHARAREAWLCTAMYRRERHMISRRSAGLPNTLTAKTNPSTACSPMPKEDGSMMSS
jgi:hypothetical protein